MTFTWEKHLSIGNRIIDSAHKEVLHIINNIIGLIMAKNVAALPEALELLESCLYACFAVEENIAQAVNFDFDQHKLMHRYLLNKVHCMKDELADKNGLWSGTEEKNYIHSLRDYFIQHIKEDSKPLKIVLDSHFYDFKPRPT